MAVTRRPKKEATKKQTTVEDLIMRGESSGTPVPGTKQESKEDAVKRVQMRIPLSKLNEIDESTKSRPGKLSRHTWIMEAIEEKLSREVEK